MPFFRIIRGLFIDILFALALTRKRTSGFIPMKIGFSEYLTNIRMKHPAFLMEQGVTAAKKVVLLSGYSDLLYFSKVLKKQMGMSPREYLHLLQENKDG